jgi:hypothetical protein
MKKIFLFASALVFSLAVMAQTQLKADDIVKFTTEKHDFGKIKQGSACNLLF